MAEYDSVAQRIIQSVFFRRNSAGEFEETYVAHIKIWEAAEDGNSKPRYILASQAANGAGFIHKSKLNTNGTFSIGKTWRLLDLKGVRVDDPSTFSITLSRTYQWQTENPRDQDHFITSLIRLFRSATGGTVPLRLEGISDPGDSTPSLPDSAARSQTPPQNTNASNTPPVVNTPRRPTPVTASRVQTPVQNGYDTESDRLPPRSQPRPSGISSRPTSPPPASTPARGYAQRDDNNGFTQVPPPSLTPRQRPARRPSNAASTLSQSSSARPSYISADSSYRDQTQSVASATYPVFDVPPLSSNEPSGATLTPTPKRPDQRVSPQSSREPMLMSRTATDGSYARKEINTRISYYDPPNQALLDRLMAGTDDAHEDIDGDEGDAQATMTSVEEMLEGYEWATDDIIGQTKARGNVDVIAARLLDELMALEKANIYSFLESDHRVDTVIKFMDQALTELDNVETLVSSYKIHLNAVNDDIDFIQSQNRGLQVQIQNQRALLNELENLVQTVHVNSEALLVLAQEPLREPAGIARVESAAVELYKALLAGRETDMAATIERLEEYRTHNAQFCKRIHDFLSITFPTRSSMLLGDNDGVQRSGSKGRPVLVNHQDVEIYLSRYSGLMLFLKEMDESVYGKTCAAYFSAASDLHAKQIKTLLTIFASMVKKAPEDDQELSFSPVLNSSTKSATSGIRRAGTIVRSPMEARNKNKTKEVEGELKVSDAFSQVLEQIAPQIYREDDFVARFLHISDAAYTFAEHVGLDSYFQRQAGRLSGLSGSTLKLVRQAMESIFGFLPHELKAWLDASIAKDGLQIIGVLAVLERFLSDADERGNAYLLHLLDKQHTRLKSLFERHVTQQIKGIEETKVTNKKRNGVVHFIKYFPIYVGRVEAQLVGADGLEIRGNVDSAYEKIVKTMFDSLKQMAKMDGEGEDKGQLNYHVILIENAHYFVAEMGQLEVGSVAAFTRQAEAIYDESLAVYVKLVLRRPFAKLIDYFEGVERLLKTTAPTEVSSNSNYNKSALKKVTKEYNAKDIRKHIDSLFKRVEKHFTEASEKATTEENGVITPGTVMVGVWKACEDEVLRLREVCAKRIGQCYADTGVVLEFTAADVEGAFRRHSVGS